MPVIFLILRKLCERKEERMRGMCKRREEGKDRQDEIVDFRLLWALGKVGDWGIWRSEGAL